MRLSQREAEKYEGVWGLSAYAKFSPGEYFADLFAEIANPEKGDTVLDIGAGSGAGSRALKDKYGLSPTALDITDKAWAQEDIHLIQTSLWKPWPVAGIYRYGYCCDVMEHIPEQFTSLVVDRALSKCAYVFLSISFEQDNLGAFIDDKLHLTVKPFTWWRDTLLELGTLIEARDLLGQGVFYVTRKS